MVTYPAPRSRVRAICGTNLSNHRARGKQQGSDCGEDRHLRQEGGVQKIFEYANIGSIL